MDSKQAKIALLAIAALLALVVFLPTARLWIHGTVQQLFGGFSMAKTIALLFGAAWIVIIHYWFSQHPNPKFQDKEKLLLVALALVIVSGFAWGFLEYRNFSEIAGSAGPFASMIRTPHYQNWESSGILHNHFPKMSVYWFESVLGISPSSQFDDGYPLYSVYPNAGMWSGVLALIFIAFISLTALYLISASPKLDSLDIALFSLFSIGFGVSLLDGGFASYAAVNSAIFFLIYCCKNYLPNSNGVLESAFPLMATASIAFLPNVLFFLPVQTASYATQLVIALGAAYYIFSRKLVRFYWLALIALIAWFLLKWILPVWVVSIIFAGVISLLFFQEKISRWERALGFLLVFAALLSAHTMQYDLENFSMGWSLKEHSANNQTVLFVYGLPPNSTEQQLNEIMLSYGTVVELHESGWAAYVKLQNPKDVRTKEIEESLRKSLQPNSYLYVDASKPETKSYTYKIQWDSTQQISDWVDLNFLGNTVLQSKDIPSNQSEIVLYGDEQRWLGLALLSEIRSNGYAGKVFVYPKPYP